MVAAVRLNNPATMTTVIAAVIRLAAGPAAAGVAAATSPPGSTGTCAARRQPSRTAGPGADHERAERERDLGAPGGEVGGSGTPNLLIRTDGLWRISVVLEDELFHYRVFRQI
jgi:hypothetical protein